MKKILIVALATLIFSFSNLMAYEKAKANTTFLDEQLGAIFAGVATATATIAATGMHVEDWMKGNINTLNEKAKEYWDSASPVVKQEFAKALNSAGDGIIVAGNWIDDFMTSVVDFYSIGNAPFSLSDVTFINNGIALSASSSYKIKVVWNGNERLSKTAYITDLPFGSTKGSYSLRDQGGWLRGPDLSFGTTELMDNYLNRLVAPLKNAVSNKNYLGVISGFRAFGYDVSLVSGTGDLVYPQNPPLELGNIRDYLNDNPPLRLGVPAQDLAIPYNLDGTALSLGADNSLTLPDGRPFEGDLTTDIVWQPSIPQVIDVAGTPTVVIDTPQGVTDLVTGEVVNPIDPAVPTDNVGFWSGLWDWLKKILNAILSIPGAILSGLLSLFISLLVPSSDFWQNNFNNLNDEIKRILPIDDYTSILDSLSRLTSPKFKDVTIPSIMGSGEVVIIEADYINNSLPTIHNWIRGFMFVLLALYNINMIYKLVRGGDAMSASNVRAARRGESN